MVLRRDAMVSPFGPRRKESSNLVSIHILLYKRYLCVCVWFWKGATSAIVFKSFLKTLGEACNFHMTCVNLP